MAGAGPADSARQPEWSTPARYRVPDDVNITDDALRRAATDPDHPAFARKVDGQWRTVTAGQFADEVNALAAGLVAAGIEPGDRVGLMSGTRYEWTLCDYAIWVAGAVTVPIYETSSPEQVAWILDDCLAVAVFVENAACRRVVARAGITAALRVWSMDADGLAALTAAGRDVDPGELARRRRAGSATDLATIVYTSGTTGRPKGCVLTHANLVAEVHSVALADGITDTVLAEGASVLLFLPLAHILARVMQLVAVHTGTLLGHTGDMTNIAAELAGFRPTVVLAVPRVFEKLYNVSAHTATAGGHARLFQAAVATAVAYSEALDHGRPGRWLRLRHRVYDRLLYRKLRAALGGRVTHAVSGGAPLGAFLGHLMRGAGLVVLEGWGLTETAAAVTLNLPDAQRIGSVGRPLPGCAVRIAPDGEVLVEGGNVFGGYWNNVTATREAVDERGWLRTGDLGELADGYLSITGRKKELIITAAGKNVAPAMVEDRLRAHWLIDQCVLVGDRRPYVGALIALDAESFGQWKQDHGKPAEAGIAELRGDAELLGVLQAAIDEVNRSTSRAEAVKRFRVLPVPFAVGAELTPSQKVRRSYVLTKYADEVEALYAGPAYPRR